MRLYVIGPVTGRENLNRKAFEDAREKLERAGYMVTIPHDFIPSDASHERAMQLSLWWIATARGDVAMLDDWATSPGALLENRVATACGLQAHCVGAWLLMAGVSPEDDKLPEETQNPPSDGVPAPSNDTSWYLIELPDGALTPYATETDDGTVYGWGEMPKRKVDLDALLKIADDLDSDGWAQFSEETVACEDVDKYEQTIAERIRKAVGR